MLPEKLFLMIIGSSFGLMTAGGVFTVLLSVGLIPRFAGKTHTGKKVLLYENMVILGTIFGNTMSVLDDFVSFFQTATELGVPRLLCRLVGILLITGFGIFAGIFVGSLAMAIAEMLDSIPIFARRIGFRHGLGITVSAMAAGKLAGSLFYFYHQMYLMGG